MFLKYFYIFLFLKIFIFLKILNINKLKLCKIYLKIYCNYYLNLLKYNQITIILNIFNYRLILYIFNIYKFN